uniref:Uncharacterized protein n=1 Tax=Candidozyma auris TaxID=498019 RepID=A0A0L0NQC8_CANAR
MRYIIRYKAEGMQKGGATDAQLDMCQIGNDQPSTLDGLQLLADLLQLGLGGSVLLVQLLILLLPVVLLLLERSHFPLQLLSLDVRLSQLGRGLLQVLVGLLQLFLQHLVLLGVVFVGSLQ